MSRGDYTVCAFFTAAGKYASQLLKASCASYAKGLRLLQRSTGPFADRSLCLLCAAPVHENTSFCGQTVSKSTSVHEIVGSGGQDIKQPESEDCGIYRKSHLEISRWLWVEIVGVEPTTPCLQSRCSSQLSYTPVSFADANMVLFF